MDAGFAIIAGLGILAALWYWIRRSYERRSAHRSALDVHGEAASIPVASMYDGGGGGADASCGDAGGGAGCGDGGV